MSRGPLMTADAMPANRVVGRSVGTEVGLGRRNKQLRKLVLDHIDFVARVLRNLGTPDAEVEDAVQRTFMVVAERIEDIRPGAEKGFLFQTAANMAAHARRTMARRREVSEEHAPEDPELVEAPDVLADQRRARQLLDRILDGMGTDLRTVFVLYEIEELTMAEIAEALAIPPGTVASRLRRARIHFKDEVERCRRTAGKGRHD